MAQHEQPGKYHDLGDEIRKAGGMPVEEKNVHGGMKSVPEETRERPLPGSEFDNTSLKEAVTRPDIPLSPNNPPENVSGIKLTPADTAKLDQYTAKKRAETAPARPTNSRKRAVLAGLALTGLLGAGAAVFGMSQGGGEQDHRSANPTAAANPNPDKPKSSVQEHEAITTPLDTSVDTTLAPIPENQLAELNNKVWPNTVEKTLAATITPDTLATLTRNNNFPRLLDTYPDWDELYSLYQDYSSDKGATGILNTLGDRSFMSRLYNEDYVAVAEAYGTSQDFRNPETANIIGKAPFVKVSEFNRAAKTGDFQSLWDKMYPADRDYEKAFLGELQAGNTNPDLIEQFVGLSILGNELQGNVDAGQTRENAEAAMRSRLTTLFEAFNKDPKAAQADYDQHHVTVTPKVTAMMDGIRQLPGQHIIAGSDAGTTLTTGIVYRNYSISGTEQLDGDYTAISVVAFVAAPTAADKNQYVMPVLLEQISRQTG